MKGSTLFALVVLVISSAVGAQSSLTNRYVVKIKNTADPQEVDRYLKSKLDLHNRARDGNHAELKVKISMDDYFAYAGVLTESLVSDLRSNDNIEYIEAEQIFKISATQNNPPSWGLARVSQHPALNKTLVYNYPDQAGDGVDVYIIDTGINVKHSDFQGRATLPISFIDGEATDDLNGHGTHVAATVGGATYGVAKKVRLIGVKVLGGDGSGTTTGVLSGIDWVANQAKTTGRKSVANMSLGGGNSDALNDAITAAVKAGVSFIVAAGNESQDACNVSPANGRSVLAVGATAITDAQADFSNFGKCVKIFAPGVDITSAWIGGNGATNQISGTSMASPHVAGIAALYLSQKTFQTPDDLYQALSSHATQNAVVGIAADTPNLLAYNSVA
ncbi:serine protease [Basidiobolus meristosporus CBS 931.73]|uniref:Serine protease n=1 Tax=Basidiobolus meristosporus CBS 931.73 TaxID=1314790 RepID=A0A1Y1WWW4_9FUNG|nr:serine protease [Basidiobolus meristosporus CBS 931.73]ORY00266.1 serine protease [Basidiobolus meristosporus CBS 931.73]|eukprot:ORX77808.1 serine protease [Basidiobolus meristosporus CBS 931.73]